MGSLNRGHHAPKSFSRPEATWLLRSSVSKQRLSGIKQTDEGHQLKNNLILVPTRVENQLFMYYVLYTYLICTCLASWACWICCQVGGGKRWFNWKHGAVENGILPCCTDTLLGDTGWLDVLSIHIHRNEIVQKKVMPDTGGMSTRTTTTKKRESHCKSLIALSSWIELLPIILFAFVSETLKMNMILITVVTFL